MGRQKTYLSGANILGFQVTIPLQLLLLAKELSFNLMFYTLVSVSRPLLWLSSPTP